MDTHRRADDPRATDLRLRRELVAQGWTDHALRQGVLGGSLAKPRTGAYVSGEDWRALDVSGRHEVTARAVVRQAQAPVIVSHTSALPFYDCPDWGLDLSTVHVTRRDGKAGRAEAGVRQHRGAVLEDDVRSLGSTQVMSPTRAALETTTVLGVEPALVQVNDLLHRGLTTPEELRRRYEASMEHWPHSLTTDLVVRLADPRWESVGESRFDFLCFQHRLPRPEPQRKIYDGRGNIVARVDFAWPDLGVFGEFDGWIKYTRLLKEGETVADVVLREKKREELVCRITGWRSLRVIWAELERPAVTAWETRKVLHRSDVA